MSDRLGLALRAAPIGLVLALGVAWLLPEPAGLSPEPRDGGTAGRVTATLDELDESPVVVVGFDPDVGTYPEIRPAVRTLLAELLERGARIVIVSLTSEGRALLLAELGRLEAAAAPGDATIVDLGFVPGVEAALVSLSRSVAAPNAPADLATRLAASGLGIADLIVVVGGNDVGPRTWVEQALPRVGSPPTIAVAPTTLLPELLPYVESGQLDALIGTPIDGATYRAAADPDPAGVAADRPVDRLALLVGVIMAIGVLGQAFAGRVVPALRVSRRGERP